MRPSATRTSAARGIAEDAGDEGADVDERRDGSVEALERGYGLNALSVCPGAGSVNEPAGV
jgi:hypothetical protein